MSKHFQHLYDFLIPALVASRERSAVTGEAIDMRAERLARKQLGLSQRALAKRVHTMIGYIAVLETGRKQHALPKILRRQMRILGGPCVTVSDLADARLVPNSELPSYSPPVDRAT